LDCPNDGREAGLTQIEKTVGEENFDLPVAPLFLCDAKGDWIELETLVATKRILMRLDSGKEYNFTAYAANGTKWIMRYESPGFSIWSRLSQFRRTPKVVVPVRWDRRGTYNVDELRAVFLKAVEHDDDVLTQFVERDDLISRLKAASSFKDFVGVWEWLGMDS
jgi:hypothetical protein